ncbi:MAG: hypothetical protein WCO45_18080 [Pseudanabaena sp. ELA607]
MTLSTTTTATLSSKIQAIAQKREVLVTLRQKDLGDLNLDVIQAIEELDDLLVLFQQKFPHIAI